MVLMLSRTGPYLQDFLHGQACCYTKVYIPSMVQACPVVAPRFTVPSMVKGLIAERVRCIGAVMCLCGQCDCGRYCSSTEGGQWASA